MFKKQLHIFLLFFMIGFKSHSQTENYPVSATLVFSAPFSLKVSDYFTSNTRMYLNLNLKDLTKPTLKIYLKWSLEGPGIRIATREGFIPASFIELSKGTVSLQKGSDLSLYFQRGMLDYQGIDEGVVFNGSMPEGFYTMKFQALEAGSGREVSNLAESFFFVTSPQPPIINQPFNGSTVAVTNPQNVLLQWTPRQISTLESQVVYEVTIYEVADGDDPVVVANSGILPKFNRTVTTTSTFMGASDLPLQEGKRYAMVVTAKDLNGKMNFENGGKSEVSWFQYGKGCFAPTGLDVAETAPGKVILSWSANTTAEGYAVEYKKKAETTWIVRGSLDNSYTINGLSPKTDYEFRVKTQCSGGKFSGYTATESVSVIGLITPTPEKEVSLEDVLDPFSQTVSTKSDGKPFDPKNIDALFALLKPPACAVSGVSYVCGQTPSATPPVGIDLTTLAKGDVLGIYDYAVLVTQVSKGSSPFEGKGLVKLPFAGNIKVPVEFKGIKAKKGEDGTNGGCVWYVPSDLNEGYFQVKGSQQDAIVKEQEKLLADIYSELIDPQSFYGTFEEALAKYEAKRKEIQAIEDAGNKARKEDYQELTKNLRGIVQGGNDWKEKLLKHFGSDASKPENKAILDKLDALKAALLACEKCVADNLATTPPKTGGGGGPMGFEDWEVNLAKCVYPDAKAVMDEAVDAVSGSEFKSDYIRSATWIDKAGKKISCLDYGVNEVFIKVFLKKSLKGKNLKINYKHFGTSSPILIKSTVYSVSVDELSLKCSIKLDRDDFVQSKEDDVANIGFEIEVEGETLPSNSKIKVHAVIFIPEIMQALGWNYSFKSQDDWFKKPENNYPWESTPQLNDFTIGWALNFQKFKDVYDANADKWKSDESIEVLKKEITKMVADGVTTLPTAKNKKTTFGLNSISDSKLVNHIIKPDELDNKPVTIQVPLFDKYYFTGFIYEEDKSGNLDDFFGSIANCNGRFTAKGTLEYIGENNIQVVITDLGFYIRDGFDFVDKKWRPSQWLGFWSLKDKKVSKDVSSSNDYRLIDNNSYNRFRADAKKGGGFYRYSNMYISHPNFKFKL